MKIAFTFSFCFFGFLFLQAQHILQSNYNLPRAGDVIIKQQVEYKDPGRSGENVLWNFGELKSVNDEYTLSYSEPVLVDDSMYVMGMDTILVKDLAEGSLLIGTEHYTMYYYYLAKNGLWVLGHENPTTLLQYTKPLIAGVYPMQYQDSCKHDYQSKGLYSFNTPFTTNGDAQIQADAYGMMILPSGDTLRNVLRTHTVQNICQVFQTGKKTESKLNSLIKTYKWYSKAYRYPVFETIQTAVLEDEKETVNFETAFFFPPQEQYYLEDDEANLALLDSVRADGISPDIDPWAGLTYNFYPNPVRNDLNIEFFMPKAGKVQMQLASRLGLKAWAKDFGTLQEGIHTASVSMLAFPVGEYVLNIWFDEYMVGNIILKM